MCSLPSFCSIRGTRAVFHGMAWPWTPWGAWQGLPESCTLSVCSVWSHVHPWGAPNLQGANLLCWWGKCQEGFSRQACPWAFPCVSELFCNFCHAEGMGVWGSCCNSQVPGNGRLRHLSSISCPHKAGLQVLVLTGRNEAFLSVEKEEILFC